MDLNLSISNDTVSTKMYDKRDDFDFDIVNFPFLDGDVPRRTSYGVYMFCAKWESVLFRNCPAQSGNSHFVGRSRNSYFAQSNSGIAPAQSGNRDKVRISIYRIRN